MTTINGARVRQRRRIRFGEDDQEGQRNGVFRTQVLAEGAKGAALGIQELRLAVDLRQGLGRADLHALPAASAAVGRNAGQHRVGHGRTLLLVRELLVVEQLRKSR